MTSNANRILCYHGGALLDENKFWPGVFIHPDTLNQQLGAIKKWGYRVISLQEAKNQINNNAIDKHTVVITIDDGFYSVKKILAPLLIQYDYPATVYVTTYYVCHQQPIFNVVLEYILFKTKKTSLTLHHVQLVLDNASTKGLVAQNTLTAINQFANELDFNGRRCLLDEIANILDVDISCHLKSRAFNNLNTAEIKQLAQQGFDIQLHTHRHRLPRDHHSAHKEIADNRQILSSILASSSSNHFNDLCYPSGVWHDDHLPMLQSANIESATTLDEGLNYGTQNILCLRRILCCDNRPIIDFEARLTGFYSLLHQLFHKS